MSILEQPAGVGASLAPTSLQTGADGGVMSTQVVDDRPKGEFSLTFEGVSDGFAKALRQFCRANAFGAFTWSHPDTGTDYLVELVEQPVISRRTAQSNSATVRLRNLLLSN